MSFKKICMFIVMSSIAFSGETFARHGGKANDDTRSRVSAKRRAIHTPRTIRKSLPQKAAPSTHLRRSLAARKRTAIPANTRKTPITAARKRTTVPANTKRAPLTTQRKAAIPSKPRGKIAHPVRGQTPLPIEKKQVPAKAPIAKKTDGWIFQDEEVKRSFAALKKAISDLEGEINVFHENVNQYGKSVKKLRRAGDALEESNKKMSDLLNTPGFEQKLKERFDKLDDKKKEEVRRLIQGLGKAPSNK